MKQDHSLKNYLLYLICSCIVVFAAVFYFRAADQKSSTTIIIDTSGNNIPEKEIVSEGTTSPVRKNNNTYNTTVRPTNTASATTTKAQDIMIDINAADVNELMQLDGIGEILANAIVNYRNNFGTFRNIEEIMNVNGIGEGIFEKNKDHIYVTDPIYPETDDQSDEYQDTNADSTGSEIISLDDLAPIDLNTADTDILILLPHIDVETALKIIEFRDKTGGFKNEYELLLIDSLTRNEVNDILPYIEIKD